MPETDPVHEALEILRDLVVRVKRIEAALPIAPDPKPQPVPDALISDIYGFRRPGPSIGRWGLGKKMSSADVNEFIQRSRYAVRYNGNLALGPQQEDEAWAEITAIQTGDPVIIAAYAEAGVDPLLVAVLLMQGQLKPVVYDANSFSVFPEQRRALVGVTPQSWLENEFAVMHGNPIVSGGDAPE